VEGKPAIRLARAAEDLQTKLGAVHDATVASAWLADLIDVEAKLKRPLGDLVEFHATAGREARRGWRDGMKRVERTWASRREKLARSEFTD
jgi:CHAD domain-containing protein